MKNLHKMITDGTLIGKYLSGAGSGDDAKVRSWRSEDPKNDELYQELQDEKKLADVLDELNQFNGEKAWMRFTSNKIRSFRNISQRWLKIAAVLVLVLGLSSVMIYHLARKEKPESFAETGKIKPGGPKAYLLLANGSVVNLTELNHSQKRQLKKSIGFEVTGNTIMATGTAEPPKKNEKTDYFTLVVPKGGEYKLVLEDSTEVWLNAGSKLKFPGQFNAGIRDVELVGEAWFKVKKDSSCPFLVRLNDMDIKVLGTEFNTSAYPDDPTVTTTLINGKVTVYYKIGISGQQNLLPGDQASYDKKKGTIHLETVDVSKFNAWKDGVFVFENQPLSDVTRILGRWYNVQFIIQGEALKNARFSGQFLRYEDIRVVFDIIRKTGTNVKFIQEGSTIKITS